ncbi:MAG TPA: hypothetical protein VFX48_06590, partial [Saprospiraceae bacterium]|nr:hypothetical protein [Saprospiraceae bacterium]
MRDTAWICICCFWLGNDAAAQQPYVMVLGIAQDGGYPHLGCEKQCCRLAWKYKEGQRSVV